MSVLPLILLTALLPLTAPSIDSGSGSAARDTLLLANPWNRGLVPCSPCPVHKYVRLVERTASNSHVQPWSRVMEYSRYAPKHFPFAERAHYSFCGAYDPKAPRLARALTCPTCERAVDEYIAAVLRMQGQPFQKVDVGQWDDPVPGSGRADAESRALGNEKRP